MGWGEYGGEEEGAAAKQKQSGYRDGRKRNLQVGLIRFDFHLYPPLPLPLSPSTSCQPNHSLNLKIDGGLFDFLLSRRAQREQSSMAGRQAGKQRQSVKVQSASRHCQVQPLITLFTQHQCCKQIPGGAQSVSISSGGSGYITQSAINLAIDQSKASN